MGKGIQLQGPLPLRTSKRRVANSLETLISGEGKDLDLHAHHTPLTCYCVFAGKLSPH